jgi:hypothetical protein
MLQFFLASSKQIVPTVPSSHCWSHIAPSRLPALPAHPTRTQSAFPTDRSFLPENAVTEKFASHAVQYREHIRESASRGAHAARLILQLPRTISLVRKRAE